MVVFTLDLDLFLSSFFFTTNQSQPSVSSDSHLTLTLCITTYTHNRHITTGQNATSYSRSSLHLASKCRGFEARSDQKEHHIRSARDSGDVLSRFGDGRCWPRERKSVSERYYHICLNFALIIYVELLSISPRPMVANKLASKIRILQTTSVSRLWIAILGMTRSSVRFQRYALQFSISFSFTLT